MSIDPIGFLDPPYHLNFSRFFVSSIDLCNPLCASDIICLSALIRHFRSTRFFFFSWLIFFLCPSIPLDSSSPEFESSLCFSSSMSSSPHSILQFLLVLLFTMSFCSSRFFVTSWLFSTSDFLNSLCHLVFLFLRKI